MSESIKAKHHLQSITEPVAGKVRPIRPKLPLRISAASAAQAVQRTFELIGGEARFAVWADENYDEFIKLWARTIAPHLPAASANIQINVGNLREHNLPPQPDSEEISR